MDPAGGNPTAVFAFCQLTQHDTSSQSGDNMRSVLLVLMVAVLAIIVAVATGFLDINQIRGARAPQISTTDNGVVAKGGQAPAFDVETGSVKVGSGETTVK